MNVWPADAKLPQAELDDLFNLASEAAQQLLAALGRKSLSIQVSEVEVTMSDQSPQSLVDLATAVQAAFGTFSSAQATARASAVQAATDAQSSDQAHKALRASIDALVAAAQAEDAPPAPSPAPAG